VINLQPDQAQAFRERLQRAGVTNYDWYPMIRGRLVRVNGKPVGEDDYTDQRARRLVERGVRFVQIYSGGMENQLSWDGHSDITGNHRQFAGETDRPVAGLLADLEQRGLLAETLVLWCGEFGRLPIAQTGPKPGRDHNPHGFSMWLAGAGVHWNAKLQFLWSGRYAPRLPRARDRSSVRKSNRGFQTPYPATLRSR